MVDQERKAFKDYFDRAAAKALAAQVSAVHPQFDSNQFVKTASKGLTTLEFNDRVKQFAAALESSLPASRSKSLKILEKSLPEPLPDCEQVTDGWLQWPVGQFVADFGVDHYKESMQLMIELTQRFSSEFAVRPFVEQYQDKVFADLLPLTAHANPHVRRWCSEGVRTRLPWGRKLTSLIVDPSPLLQILDALKDDAELYVQKSVANNINDISRDHPDVALKLCKRWSKKSNPGRDWIIKSGLRTLIKNGDREALSIIGYAKPRALATTLALKPKRLQIGDSVQMVCEIASTASTPQKLLVDYVVHYVRQGGRVSGKVFKWKELTIQPGETVILKKKQAFKETSIRALYPGSHQIELQVNGQRMAEATVNLKE